NPKSTVSLAGSHRPAPVVRLLRVLSVPIEFFGGAALDRRRTRRARILSCHRTHSARHDRILGGGGVRHCQVSGWCAVLLAWLTAEFSRGHARLGALRFSVCSWWRVAVVHAGLGRQSPSSVFGLGRDGQSFFSLVLLPQLWHRNGHHQPQFSVRRC